MALELVSQGEILKDLTSEVVNKHGFYERILSESTPVEKRGRKQESVEGKVEL